jgi:hypothetical protein
MVRSTRKAPPKSKPKSRRPSKQPRKAKKPGRHVSRSKSPPPILPPGSATQELPQRPAVASTAVRTTLGPMGMPMSARTAVTPLTGVQAIGAVGSFGVTVTNPAPTLTISPGDREAARLRLDTIEAALTRVIPFAEELEAARREHGGMGHNKPPDGLTVEDVRVGIDAANVFRTQISGPHDPRRDIVRICGAALRWVVEKIGAELHHLGKGFFMTTGGFVATEVWPGLQPAVHDLVALIQSWL